MADSTLYDTTVPTAGTLALAHEQILRYKVNGVYINITGDINNLAPNPSPITIPREVYGTKGRTSSQITGYNFAPTFSVEAVRDNTGAIAQSWLVDLLNKAYSEGAANLGEFQIFDAKDANLPAFEGTFSVAVAPLNTGYTDKGGYSFTLTSDGVVQKITSPIAGTGVPILESALPSGLGASKNVVVRGYNLGTSVSATVGGVEATSITRVDNNVLVVELPAGSAGSAPIVVTNAKGASTAIPYVRAV